MMFPQQQRILAAILLLGMAAVGLLATGAVAADDLPKAFVDQGSALARLSAVQVDDSIRLRWEDAAPIEGEVTIYRWVDVDEPKALSRLRGETRYDDRSAEINRIYYYRVEDANGRRTNTATGVRSDVHRTFTCPALPAVTDGMLGVDRTETFTTPSGKEISFTIRAPEPRPTLSTVPSCNGRAGCSDYTNIAEAIAGVIKAGGGRVQLESGTYDMHIPADSKAYAQIAIYNGTDLVLAGAGQDRGLPRTHIVLDAGTTGGVNASVMVGLAISSGQRILIKDIAFDWNRPLAIPGSVVDAGPGQQHFVINDPGYYVPNPDDPPVINLIDGYDLANRTYTYEPWARNGFVLGDVKFNPDFVTDHNYYYVFRGGSIPSGSTVVGIVHAGSVVRVAGASSDISFEGVQIWGGGAGFVFGPNSRGFRISNSKITRKPDQLLKPGERPRLISLRGDSDARATEGDLLIESSEFALIEDDAFNVVGVLVQGAHGTEIISPSDIKFVFKGFDPFAHEWARGDTLLLLDPVTLKPISAAALRVASRSKAFDKAAGEFTFRFKLAEDVPTLMSYRGRPVEALPYFAEPRNASAPYVVRDTCIRDTAGGRLIVQSGPGLIENNVVANTGNSGIEISANPYNWREGPGAIDVIVGNNKVVGAGYWLVDHDAAGRLTGRSTGWLVGPSIAVSALARSGFIANAGPNRFLQIYGNFIANAPGLGILVAAASDVVVSDNVLVNANTIPFIRDYDAKFCGAHSQGYHPEGVNQPWCFAKTAARGSIMVTQARNVQLYGNVMLGSSEGVFVDGSSTK
jgi:hypothetical protein